MNQRYKKNANYLCFLKYIEYICGMNNKLKILLCTSIIVFATLFLVAEQVSAVPAQLVRSEISHGDQYFVCGLQSIYDSSVTQRAKTIQPNSFPRLISAGGAQLIANINYDNYKGHCYGVVFDYINPQAYIYSQQSHYYIFALRRIRI